MGPGEATVERGRHEMVQPKHGRHRQEPGRIVIVLLFPVEPHPLHRVVLLFRRETHGLSVPKNLGAQSPRRSDGYRPSRPEGKAKTYAVLG